MAEKMDDFETHVNDKNGNEQDECEIDSFVLFRSLLSVLPHRRFQATR